jgi:hypothetical protein
MLLAERNEFGLNALLGIWLPCAIVLTKYGYRDAAEPGPKHAALLCRKKRAPPRNRRELEEANFTKSDSL